MSVEVSCAPVEPMDASIESLTSLIEILPLKMKAVKKECVKSVLRFLKREMTSPDLDDEQKESITVAKQCLEVSYELEDDDTVETAENLEEIFLKLDIPLDMRTPEQKKVDAEVEKVKGNDCMRDGKFTEALTHYTRAIKLNKDEAIYYGNRAAAFSRLDKNKEAITDCQEAIRLDPSYGKAYGRLGIAYSNLMMYKEAADAYKQALELDPNNASYEANLKLAQEKLNPGAASMNNFDFGGFMNNPALLNMASQMLSDPAFRTMVSGIVTSGQSGEPSLDSFVEVGQQLAEHMQANNPNVLEQLRAQFQGAPEQEAATATATTDGAGGKDDARND